MWKNNFCTALFKLQYCLLAVHFGPGDEIRQDCEFLKVLFKCFLLDFEKISYIFLMFSENILLVMSYEQYFDFKHYSNTYLRDTV